MPSRNVIKEFASDHYYHVYNRGVAKQIIFLDSQDKQQFLKILKRHLDPDDTSTKQGGQPYRKFSADLELLSFCLMGNHFHLLFYIKGDPKAVSMCMQSMLTAYTMYFNRWHKRIGALFQGVFKASRISNDSYLLHITRYIHLNPRTYKTYRYSSLPYYLGKEAAEWLQPQRVLGMFEGESYEEFVEDYEDYKAMLDEVKRELADY